jgi:hypothetical protein
MILVLALILSGCSKFAAEEEYESDVAECMTAGGSHLECEQKARDLTCVRAGSRYGAHANDEQIHYRCSDGSYDTK